FFTLIMSCEEIIPNVDHSPGSAGYPFITSFTPESAECGTEITLYGGNFGTSTAENYVTFNNWNSEIPSNRIVEDIQVHADRLLVRIPMNLIPGDYAVSVDVKGNVGQSVRAFRIKAEN